MEHQFADIGTFSKASFKVLLAINNGLFECGYNLPRTLEFFCKVGLNDVYITAGQDY